jgi:hypothetical protein
VVRTGGAQLLSKEGVRWTSANHQCARTDCSLSCGDELINPELASAVRLNENAIHLPASLDMLKLQRTAEFTSKEFYVWENLPAEPPVKGFSQLEEPLRGYAYEVATYYQSISCVAIYGIADWRFLAVQTEWRLLRTWEVIEAHVRGERTYRGPENSFLNSYEQFVAKVRSADLADATERLYRGGKGLEPF